MTPITRQWLLRLTKLAIVALLVWGVSSTLRKAWSDLESHPWTVRPGWLVVSGVFYLLGSLPSGYFWYRILRTLDQRPTLIEAMRAYFIGHLGKYVPGKAMVVVLRAGLLKSDRVDATLAGFAVFLETLTTMAVGGFVAALVLLVAFPEHRMMSLLAIGLMVASGLPTLPPVFRRIVRLMPQRVASSAAAAPLERITFSLMAAGWLGIAAGWALMGLSLWATLQAIAVDFSDIPLLTAAVALAVVAGFLSLIPGGAVVRELVLAELLVRRLGAGDAVVSAVFLRLIWLVAELLISVILYWCGKNERPS